MKEVPESLRPYTFHGLDLKIGSEEAMGECPFCGKAEKFNINISTTLYQCWAGGCAVKGNPVTFLRELWEMCAKATTKKDYQTLADESGFMTPEAAQKFGVVKSVLTDKWLVPGYNVESKLTGLYKFTKIKLPNGKWVPKLLPTPGLGHHLFNLQNYESQKPIVDLCEGWRDGIAWQECIDLGITESGVTYATDRNVIAVPGVNSFKPQWSKFFAGKEVNILFDNDHVSFNKDTKAPIESAGVKGVKTVASILMSYEVPPAKINYIAWGGDKEGYTEELPDGHDLRDFLRSN